MNACPSNAAYCVVLVRSTLSSLFLDFVVASLFGSSLGGAELSGTELWLGRLTLSELIEPGYGGLDAASSRLCGAGLGCGSCKWRDLLRVRDLIVPVLLLQI